MNARSATSLFADFLEAHASVKDVRSRICRVHTYDAPLLLDGVDAALLLDGVDVPLFLDGFDARWIQAGFSMWLVCRCIQSVYLRWKLFLKHAPYVTIETIGAVAAGHLNIVWELYFFKYYWQKHWRVPISQRTYENSPFLWYSISLACDEGEFLDHCA